MDRPIVPLSDMARLLRVPPSWLRAEAEAGRVPCLRAGRVLLFAPSIVTQHLAERAARERCRTPEAEGD